MPRKGYVAVTVKQATYDILEAEAERRALTVPALLREFAIAVQGAGQGISKVHFAVMDNVRAADPKRC